MKNLKKLREAANCTQDQIAEILNTTQQSVARWEQSKSEPSLAQLRDLAMYFGVSVDYLIGKSKDNTSTQLSYLMNGTVDGFWGHIGLKVNSGLMKWFPITVESYRLLFSNINQDSSQLNEWMVFTSLADKFVAFRPKGIIKVFFMEDSADPPQDWVQEYPYSGYSPELYKGIRELNELHLISDWQEAVEICPVYDAKGVLEKGNPEKWAALVSSVAKGFISDVSDKFASCVLEAFIEYELFNSENYERLIGKTLVYFEDGSVDQICAEAENLYTMICAMDGGDDATLLRIDIEDDEGVAYYPSAKLSAIVMPLVEIQEAMDAETAIYEAEEKEREEAEKAEKAEKKPKPKKLN